MGYTHYWRLSKGADNDGAYQALCRDAFRLFAYCDLMGPSLAGPFGTGAPEVTADAIAFNGAEPDAYETFRFERVPGAIGADFCKTAQRAYDPAVVALLLLAAQHYGDQVRISSDGDAAELQCGADLLARAFPDREAVTVAPFLSHG